MDGRDGFPDAAGRPPGSPKRLPDFATAKAQRHAMVEQAKEIIGAAEELLPDVVATSVIEAARRIIRLVEVCDGDEGQCNYPES